MRLRLSCPKPSFDLSIFSQLPQAFGEQPILAGADFAEIPICILNSALKASAHAVQRRS